MIITRSPFRISFFGGSTDYPSFYSKYGSLVIGTTINQYMYIAIRHRHRICGAKSMFSYRKLETVTDFKDLEHPVLKYLFSGYPKPVSMSLFSDIPSRTGLGGSSTFVVGLLHSLNSLNGFSDKEIDRKELALNAIDLERNQLGESGGVQDQIWAAYGGLNSIEIDRWGEFYVRPLPVSPEFKKELEKHLILVYTNGNRTSDKIAKSHEQGEEYKLRIKELAEHGYRAFKLELLEDIGQLIYQSWLEKRAISDMISTPKIDEICDIMMTTGCWGVKLLGTGQSGFVLGVCDPKTKEKIKEIFPKSTLEVGLDEEGVKSII